MAKRHIKQIDTPDGISWHVEIFNQKVTNPNYIVLIPSGEGDCGSQTAVATILSGSPHDYTIVTFDTPGMSRTTAPDAAIVKVTPQLLATQIIGLLDTLNINKAAFFGCSSGGGAALALAALYPSRVLCCIVHEVPMNRFAEMDPMLKMSDEELIATCQFIFDNVIIEQDGLAKWKGLGAEHHDRLKPNFVKWVRNYTYSFEDAANEMFVGHPENLRHRPVFWTVGALREGVKEGEGMWEVNFMAAKAAGLTVDGERLRCNHLPNVTVPEDTAAWIGECVNKVGSD